MHAQRFPLSDPPTFDDLESDEGVVSILTQFQNVGGGIILGDHGIAVTKGYCRVERTDTGWTLYRSARDERGRFFCEHATLEEALAMIRDGEVPREGDTLTNHEAARRLLSDAIRDAYGADSVHGERLLEALDLLAS
jgi:hypothetical protein